MIPIVQRLPENPSPIIEADYVVRRPPRRALRWMRDALGMARATYGLWGLIVRLLLVATALAMGCATVAAFVVITLRR